MTLQAHDVSLRLGGAQVLDGVSVSVTPGEVLVLVGPNGAGKSTLRGVLAADLTPDSGQVLLDGVDIADTSARTLSRQRSVLPQRPGVSFGFRVVEVVEMGRAPWRGRPESDQDEETIRDAMLATDVASMATRSFPTLSGGEQSRASLARVLAQSTPVMLLDEPTAALDLHHQEEVLAIARRTADAGAAVVVVLHDLSLAAAWADRICMLSAGRVVADGHPDQVLRPDLIAEVYDHSVDVFAHRGRLLVVPIREALR